MKKLLLITAILTFVFSGESFAQLADRARLDALTQSNSLGVKPARTPFSLLDLSRMRWSHSYTVSYFSAGGSDASVGFLRSMMVYDLSSALTLGVSLGLAHDIGGTPRVGNRAAAVYPGLWLDFHPSEKLSMSVAFQRLPSINDPYSYGRAAWPRYWSPY
ncbi:MAG TPA: hypothetical protein VN285_09680 [Candidatus Deferrimicrobium sp.]|nr:hypothetical protein [Candidatus Deferrimicrobium sp.]